MILIADPPFSGLGSVLLARSMRRTSAVLFVGALLAQHAATA